LSDIIIIFKPLSDIIIIFKPLSDIIIIFKPLSDIIIILKPLSDIIMMMNDVNFEEGTFIFYQEIFYLVLVGCSFKNRN